jgi:acetylornithine deacetylase/succinyl-diaminopimelate desuccinylase-like protein
LACHTDTVSPQDNSQLKIKIIKDQVFGLGTKDMKGGIVSSLLSLSQIPDLSKVCLVFYGDEEQTQKGIKHLVNFLPKLVKTNQLIVSPESRFNLGYGARGIIVIQLEIIGVRAHSARPQLGKDAIWGTYQIVSDLQKKYHKSTNLGQTSFTITHITGGQLSQSGIVLDSHGSIPDLSRFTLSIRNSYPNLNSGILLKDVHVVTDKLGLKIKSEQVLVDHPARIVSQKVIKQITTAVQKNIGITLKLGDPKTSGYNDAALLGKALNCPVVNFGPYGENNHTKNEWVSLKSIQDAAHILASIINNF